MLIDSNTKMLAAAVITAGILDRAKWTDDMDYITSEAVKFTDMLIAKLDNHYGS